jgi:hypothetical protein
MKKKIKIDFWIINLFNLFVLVFTILRLVRRYFNSWITVVEIFFFCSLYWQLVVNFSQIIFALYVGNLEDKYGVVQTSIFKIYLLY